MKHRRLMVLALAAALGCGKAGPKIIVDDIPAGEVHLIGAGAEPRVPMRYQVAKGTRATLDMTMRVSLVAGGVPMPPLPLIRMSMDEECVDVEPTGAMRFEVKVGSLTTDGTGQMADAMKMVRDMKKNMVYRFRLSPSGKVDDVAVEGLTGPMAELGTQLKDSIEQFAAPLPEEPIGKGATWKFKRTGKTNGIDVATVNLYELVDVHDQVATFKVDGRVVAPSQTIELMGASIELVKLDGKVSGSITNDLRGFAPTGTFGVTMGMAVSTHGRTVKMDMTLDSAITAR